MNPPPFGGLILAGLGVVNAGKVAFGANFGRFSGAPPSKTPALGVAFPISSPGG